MKNRCRCRDCLEDDAHTLAMKRRDDLVLKKLQDGFRNGDNWIFDVMRELEEDPEYLDVLLLICELSDNVERGKGERMTDQALSGLAYTLGRMVFRKANKLWGEKLERKEEQRLMEVV